AIGARGNNYRSHGKVSGGGCGGQTGEFGPAGPGVVFMQAFVVA
ncbi:MAG: hypothetical protein RL748_3073, partial [Pseudomonadota bacterium]